MRGSPSGGHLGNQGQPGGAQNREDNTEDAAERPQSDDDLKEKGRYGRPKTTKRPQSECRYSQNGKNHEKKSTERPQIYRRRIPRRARTLSVCRRHAFAPHHAQKICRPKMESRKKAMVIFGEFQEALYGLTVRGHMEEEEVIYTKE